MLKRAPVLTWFVALWAVAELGAAFVLPAVVPDSAYADWILPEQGEEAIRSFLDGSHILTPHADVGWHSTAEWDQGYWTTDSIGARLTPEPTAYADSVGQRVLLLGSSMVHGGAGVAPETTLAAQLGSGTVRAETHAVSLFGPDQSLLTYRHRIRHLDADVVVVGVDADPFGPLRTIWTTLRKPGELNAPFLKPRFMLDGGELRMVRVDPALLALDRRGELIDIVRETDSYEADFDRFRRFEQTPLTALFTWGWGVFQRRILTPTDDPADLELLDAVLSELRADVEADGRRLVVMVMPSDRGSPSSQRSAIAERVEHWRGMDFDVVDGARAFAEAEAPEWELYMPDGVHPSEEGNRLLAEALRSALDR